MSIRKSVAGFASVFVALAMVLGVFAYAPSAQAQTTAELQAQIQDLLATIAALQAQISGVSGTSCPVLTQPMTIGSQGPNVVALQDYLTTTGHFTFAGGSTGYFGPITQQAVASWQAANGVAPAAGYWGPISLAKYNSICTPLADDDDDDMDDDDDTADGDEGSFIVTRGSASSAVLDLGDEEDIYSIDVEANDSNITVNRLDFNFDARPWLYIDELIVTVDGEEIADKNLSSSNVTELSSTEWRVRFTGLDYEVEEDDEVEFVLWAVTPDSLPGSRANDSVAVHVPDDGVRGEDEAGLIHYEPSSDLSSRSFSFDENFGLGDIEVSENDNSPETGIIVVSSTTETSNVEVLMFDVQADNGPATVEEVYIEATTTTADADDMISELCLFNGSVELDCETLTLATASITNRSVATGIVAGEYYALFDDLEFEMDAEEEVTFTVEAHFNEADGTNYASGDTVTFEAAQVAGYNEDFEDTADATTIGSDETFTLLTEGIFIEAVSTSESAVVDPGSDGGSDQYVTFTVKFDVTAVEEDAFIYRTDAAGTSTEAAGIEYNIMQNGSIVTNFSGTTTDNVSTNADSKTNSWKINKGSTKSFTLQVLLDPSTAGFYGIELEAVEFAGTDNATESAYTEVAVPDTSEFQTDEVNIPNS